MHRIRPLAVLAWLAVAVASGTSSAAEGEGGAGFRMTGTCRAAMFAAPATVSPTPRVRTWFARDGLSASLRRCFGLADDGFSVLVATQGAFSAPGGAAPLLRRIGSISALRGIRYWSVTRGRWRRLITKAYALAGPDRDLRRGDFLPAELRRGADLYFWQAEHTPAGEVLYRVSMREVTDRSIVFEMANQLPVRVMFIPVIERDAYASHFALRRRDDGVWTYVALMKMTYDGPLLLALREHRPSFVNRAVAAYRYIAGYATDGFPPLARVPDPAEDRDAAVPND